MRFFTMLMIITVMGHEIQGEAREENSNERFNAPGSEDLAWNVYRHPEHDEPNTRSNNPVEDDNLNRFNPAAAIAAFVYTEEKSIKDNGV